MNFSGHVQDADMEEALLALRQADAISLNECAHISDKCAQNFFDQCGSLYSLIIRGCTWLTDDTLRVVADCHPDLEVFRISDAPMITDAGLTYVASHCHGLDIVELEKCILVGDSFIRMLGSLQVPYLNISECPQVSEEALLAFIAETGDKLLTFAVSFNERITDRTLQALAQYCPHLLNLDVGDCINVTDAGLSALILACEELIVLYVEGCVLSSATLHMLSTTICTNIEKICVTDCLDMRDRHIEQLTSRATLIQELGISGSKHLTNQSLISIGNHLSCLEELRVQDCNNFDYTGFTAVAQGCLQLRILDVAFCEHFDDNSLREIAVHCLHLSELHISYTSGISDIGVGYLAEHSAHLMSIDITSTRVTEKAVTRLVQSCLKLTNIEWRTRESVSDALQQLAQCKVTLELGTEESLLSFGDTDEDDEDDQEEEIPWEEWFW
eukprot:gene14509-16656_t